MSNLIGVYNSEGQKLSTQSLSLFGLKLLIPSPSYNLVEETLDDGTVIVVEKHLLPRDLIASFFTRSGDYEETLKLRDDLYKILSNGNEIYVSETKNLGKRWKVHVGGWSPERLNLTVKRFDIPVRAISGMSESVNVIERNFDSTEFVLRNEGNCKIDMTKQTETEITFRGTSNNLTITNHTTGDVWKYNGSTTVNDEIKLVGVRSLKNGLSVFGQTNKKLISFAPGNNKFEIEGATGEFEISISTRFYFL